MFGNKKKMAQLDRIEADVRRTGEAHSAIMAQQAAAIEIMRETDAQIKALGERISFYMRPKL